MSKKKVNQGLKKLSFSDLYSMYIFVNSLNNTTFGKRTGAKAMVRGKLNLIEDELYGRVFGENPFKIDSLVEQQMVEFNGEDPIKVVESFSKEQNFIVSKNVKGK